MTPTLAELDKKARKLGERTLEADEELVAVIRGRSKQAMIVTGRRIIIVKPGSWLGRGLDPRRRRFR